MAIVATATVFFESTRSISGVLFAFTVIALGVTLAVKQADEPHTIHLFVYWLYTGAYSIAAMALLYAYGFDFATDTLWVLIATVSSLVFGSITGGLMTTNDPDEEERLQIALVAFVALGIIIFGFCMMAAVSVAVGLLIVGIVVAIAGIIQYLVDDDWALLTTIISVVLLIASAIGFAIDGLYFAPAIIFIGWAVAVTYSDQENETASEDTFVIMMVMYFIALVMNWIGILFFPDGDFLTVSSLAFSTSAFPLAVYCSQKREWLGVGLFLFIAVGQLLLFMSNT
jgi:hypothetical protein